MSKSLRSLTKNERMSELLVCFLSKLLIRLQKNERFTQKSDELIPSPGKNMFSPLSLA